MLRHLALISLGSVLLNGCATTQHLSLARQEAPEMTTPPATGATAPTVSSAQPAADIATPQSGQRQVIYDATLQMVVPDPTIAMQSIEQTAKGLGGYLQQMQADSITVRVPAAKLTDAISAAEKLGQVTDRSIRGQDITEEMHDLQIRFETALQVRQRLLALLDKADKTADAIKIEQELERIIGTIEQLKGKIRFYETQVAYSTLTVKLNSPAAPQTMEERVPFTWVRELGSGLVGEAVPRPPQENASHGIHFTLPKSYIRYYGSDDVAEAMSGQEVYIRVQRHDNHEGGDLGFWSTLSRRVLQESRSVAIANESDVTLRTGAQAHVFIGTRQLAGKPRGYLLALITRKHELYTFESWGPAEAFNADHDELMKSLQSLEVKP